VKRWNSALLGWEAWVADPKIYAHPHMHYHMKLVVLRQSRRKYQKLGSAGAQPLGVGAWLTP